MSQITDLLGETLIKIENNENQELRFKTKSGKSFVMFHSQDCCENVELEDIVGDLSDLLNSPILQAEEISNSDDPPVTEYEPESYTWTYYKLGTIKGSVTLRWYGSSNGYYSESVSFMSADEQKNWY